jgi:hypothetical protein
VRASGEVKVKAPKLLMLTMAIALTAAAHAQQGQTEPSGPSLKETLRWMQDLFPVSQTLTDRRAGEKRELTFSECTVTIRENWVTHDDPSVRRETIVDLSLIDPQSIQSYAGDLDSEKKIGIVMMTATNGKKVITAAAENTLTKARIGKPFSSQHLWLYFVRPDYAERFAKAFRHAVEHCGGMPSAF